MQLLGGKLRCLRALRCNGSHVKLLRRVNFEYDELHGHVVKQQRQYSTPASIAMAHNEFKPPNVDASRPPLITMHGLFGSKQNWRSISKALASKTNRLIYTVDLRNHGDSPHTDVHGSPGMTADLQAFLQSKSLPNASIMGHSMGGRTAMHFALHNPQLCERLIVVDISPVSMPRTLEDMDGILNAMKNLNVPSDLTLSKGRQWAKEQLSDDVGRDSVDFILLNLRKKPQSGDFYWACNVDVLISSLKGFTNYATNIANQPPFTGPTTFICGSHSAYMGRDDWPRILEIFPNASIHWLDTGHLVHLEEPHKFIEIVSNFLNA